MSYQLRKSSASWLKLCSSLDVIEDTDEAIRAFDPTPTNRQALREDMGKRYLALYGVLQAMYTQQDAVTNLHRALELSFALKIHPNTWKARQVRNASIGHPTEQSHPGPTFYNFVARITMNYPTQIRLARYEADGTPDLQNIDLIGLIDGQRTEIESILSNVVTTLRQRIDDHRAKFMNDKMQDVIPATLAYALEKLFESFRTPDRSIGGMWCVDEVEDTLDAVRTYLRRQDMDIDTFEVLELIYEELAYPLRHLRAYLEGTTSDITTTELATIVASYVKAKVDELKQFAADFDSGEDVVADSEEDQLDVSPG